MQIEKVSEQEWRLLELIGLDVKTRDIATLFRCTRDKVWRMRGTLGQKLGLRGNRLVVMAVKAVWMQEHDKEHQHIATIFKKLTQPKTPK